MTSKKLRIVPIWYQIDFNAVQRAAPMLADIKAITANGNADVDISSVCKTLSRHTDQSNVDHGFMNYFLDA